MQIAFYPHIPFVCALAPDEFNNTSYMTTLLMLALTISNQHMQSLNSHCYEKEYSTELSKELNMMLIFSNKLIRHCHHVQVTQLLLVYIEYHNLVEMRLCHTTPQVRLNVPQSRKRALAYCITSWHNSDQEKNTANLLEEAPGI